MSVPRRTVLALLLLLLSAPSLTLSSLTELPPEERLSVGWVAAFNEGEEALAAYRQASYAPALLAAGDDQGWRQIFRRMKEDLGSLEVGDLRLQEGTAVLVCQGSTGEVVSLSFELAEGKIDRLAIDLGPRPGQSDLPPLEVPDGASAQEVRQAVDAYLRDLAERDLFSGVVLAARGDEVVFHEAYGWASRRFQVPNRKTTRFDVGSITKSFTKVAIAKLMEAGKLDLDQTLGHYLADYPNAEVARRVKVRHLVDHTSGLGDVFTPEYFRLSKLRLRQPADYLPIFADDPLAFEPGARRSYSNYGYVVLGLIIERVSGKSYYDYVREVIFEPAGMDRSAFFESDLPVEDLAIGHTRYDQQGQVGEVLRENTLRFPVRGAPDGQSHSPAIDLLRFDRALRHHRLLSPPYTRWVLERTEGPGSADPAPVDVGWGIAGGAPGLNALMESDGESALIVLANLDEPVAEELGMERLRPILRPLLIEEASGDR